MEKPVKLNRCNRPIAIFYADRIESNGYEQPYIVMHDPMTILMPWQKISTVKAPANCLKDIRFLDLSVKKP